MSGTGAPPAQPRKAVGPATERLRLADRLALSIGEAATAVGVSERHLRSMIHEIPHLHIGKRVVIPVGPLEEWLRKRAVAEKGRVEEIVDDVLASVTGSRGK